MSGMSVSIILPLRRAPVADEKARCPIGGCPTGGFPKEGWYSPRGRGVRRPPKRCRDFGFAVLVSIDSRRSSIDVSWFFPQARHLVCAIASQIHTLISTAAHLFGAALVPV